MNAMANSDDRGWSLSDHLLGIDEGGSEAGFAVGDGLRPASAVTVR